MGRYDAGHIEIPAGFSIEAGMSLLDELEDIDPAVMSQAGPGAAMDGRRSQPGAKTGRMKPGATISRRRIEDRLEELRLQRQITDYSFRGH